MPGAYVNLMATVNDSVLAFYQDLSNQGLLGSTLVIVFSEFGRRISENGSTGTDHGAAGVMMALGGSVRGGIYGTAADLRQDAANPTLENNAGDVKFETDFRSVYAKVHRQLARLELGLDPRRRFQGRRAEHSVTGSRKPG